MKFIILLLLLSLSLLAVKAYDEESIDEEIYDQQEEQYLQPPPQQQHQQQQVRLTPEMLTALLAEMTPDCRSHLEIAVETNSGNIPEECNVEIQSILPDILAKLGYNSFNENGEPVPAPDTYDENYSQPPRKASKSDSVEEEGKNDSNRVLLYILGFVALFISIPVAAAFTMFKNKGPIKQKELSKKKQEKLRMKEAQRKK